MMPKNLLSKVRRLRKDEAGNVTIEYVLWLPIWILIMTMTTDVTILFHQRSQLFISARDMSRAVAVGAKTPDEAETLIKQAYSEVEGFNASITTANGFVTTRLTAPFSAFSTMTATFANGTLGSTVTMFIEGQDTGA
ncbi:TadE/TadG family type IV pilus assembly protein [Pelagovum pacificum]|nr:TadE/TadG family type IV pilus assembly protein [Pelagovum pacificum]